MTQNQKDQANRIFEVFSQKPLTMLMASKITGIERANICRYVSTLRKSEKVALFAIKECEVTRHRAGYYTADENLFPSKNQLRIWS